VPTRIVWHSAEREALAADRCPGEYLAAWARFQLVRPRWALEGEWLEAIEGAGLFLDRWGADAAAYGWTCEQTSGAMVWPSRGEGLACGRWGGGTWIWTMEGGSSARVSKIRNLSPLL
jgi:hypothetical protein